jgi:peptide/nickel transport system permease protein
MNRVVEGCLEYGLYLLCATLVLFLLLYQIPIDPVLAQLSDISSANPELVAYYREKFEILSWQSIATGRHVIVDLLQYAPPTILLSTIALIIATIGSFAIVFFLPKISEYAAVISTSMPTFLLAYIFLFVFYGYLGIAPGPGYYSWSQIVMPSFVLAVTIIGPLIQIIHTSMMEQRGQNYVRTARAKGIRNLRIEYNHILPNAAPPILASFGMIYATLLAGAVMTETIFAIPGLGRYTHLAASKADVNALLAIILMTTTIYFFLMKTTEYAIRKILGH